MQKLFYNGPVITMENEKPVEALLIEDDKILAVGCLAEVEAAAAPDVERIDLEGRTLIPAFIDAHSHTVQAHSYFLQVRLESAKNFDDIVEILRNHIKEHNIQPGEWIRSMGYDQNVLEEKCHPTAAILDKAAPDNPLIAIQCSGHMAVYNTRAMEFLHTPNRSDAIPGGYIEIKDGKPTGYMEENANFDSLKKIPLPSPEETAKCLEAVQQWYLSNGITVAQESVGIDQMIPLYQSMLKANTLHLNIIGYPCFHEAEATEKAFGNLPEGSKLRIGGYKMLLDGSPQGRTAWTRKPYLDSDNFCYHGILDDDTVYANICKATKENKQIITHCNGDAAAEQYIRVIEKAEANGYDVAKIRPVMIHAQLLGRDQLARVKKAGIIPSFFVAHTYYWGDAHLKNLGPERANYISPTASALREGILFTFHQDVPVIAPDMMETIWCATNRITKAGVQLSKDECISTYEAMRAVTINAAYQYFEENVRGSLKAGKKADLAILSDNPLDYPKENLRDIKVLATFKDGECLYKKD